MDPVVTVLMPAYNSAKFISEAISAILSQTFQTFEFLIINDGSTDATSDIIKTFNDPRIRFYENERNLGLVNTLNIGIEISRGKYILRTDADDISLPNMISDLARFMESNDDHIICGGQMKDLKSGKLIRYPLLDKDLKLFTLNQCPFSHSTVIFRKQILVDQGLSYSKSFPDGEDHGLWSQMLPFGKFHNLDKPTLLYRVSEYQITANKKYNINYNFSRQQIFIIQAKLYFNLDAVSANLYSRLILGDKIDSLDDLEKIGMLISEIIKRNMVNNLFNNNGLIGQLFIKWYWLCYNSYDLGKIVFKVYLKYMPSVGRIRRVKSKMNHFMKMSKLN